jgi:hypothetical protein
MTGLSGVLASSRAQSYQRGPLGSGAAALPVPTGDR